MAANNQNLNHLFSPALNPASDGATKNARQPKLRLRLEAKLRDYKALLKCEKSELLRLQKQADELMEQYHEIKNLLDTLRYKVLLTRVEAEDALQKRDDWKEKKRCSVKNIQWAANDVADSESVISNLEKLIEKELVKDALGR